MGSGPLETIIVIAFQLFSLLLLARILIGWINLDPYHPIVQFLFRVTEPFLAPVRRILPPAGMFDFSPMVVLILAIVVEAVLIQFVRALF